MNKSLTFLFAFVGMFLASSCQLDEPDKDVVVSIETDFNISIAENLTAESSLIFDVETVVERPCLNSVVGLQTVVSENRITLFINDIEDPTQCMAGSASAKGSNETDRVFDGNYEMVILLQNAIENSGTLKVTGEGFQVNMDTDDGAAYVENNFLKIPDRTIWGYFAFDDDTLGEEIQSIIQEMEMNSQEMELPDGHFGHFTTLGNQILWVRNQPTKNKFVPFLFQNGDYLNELVKIFSDFKAEKDESEIEAELLLWDGRSY